jgi:conjugal transfer/entry exclusion protein
MNISRNQSTIIENVAQYLASLDGNDWGQCGDVVFFLQGAYRDAEGSTKTFQCVFSTIHHVYVLN